jgi:hypothetical protein
MKMRRASLSGCSPQSRFPYSSEFTLIGWPRVGGYAASRISSTNSQCADLMIFAVTNYESSYLIRSNIASREGSQRSRNDPQPVGKLTTFRSLPVTMLCT